MADAGTSIMKTPTSPRSALLERLRKVMASKPLKTPASKGKNLVATLKKVLDKRKPTTLEPCLSIPAPGTTISAYDWAQHKVDQFTITKLYDDSLDELVGEPVDSMPKCKYGLKDARVTLIDAQPGAVALLAKASKGRSKGIRALLGVQYYTYHSTSKMLQQHDLQTTSTSVITTNGGIAKWYATQVERLEANLEEFNSGPSGSGWVFVGVRDVYIRYFKTNSTRKGGAWMPTPEWCNSKQGIAVVNLTCEGAPQGFDKTPHEDRCFEHALMAFLAYEKMRENTKDDNVKAKTLERLDYYYGDSKPALKKRKGVDFADLLAQTFNLINIAAPTPIAQLDKFEADNPGYSVCLLHLGTEHVKQPSGRVQAVPQMDILRSARHDVPADNIIWMGLLGASPDAHGSDTGHYVWIRHPSALVYSETNHKTHMPCRNCMHSMLRENLERHEDLCCQHRPYKPRMPEPDPNTGVVPAVEVCKSRGSTMDYPFMGAFDLEAFTVHDGSITYTRADGTVAAVPDGHQEMSSGTYVIVSEDGKLLANGRMTTDAKTLEDLREFRHAFFTEMFETGQRLREAYFCDQENYPKPPKLSAEDQAKHDAASHCHICKRPGFSKTNKKYQKVIDHDHATNEYRGPAHAICNLNHTMKNGGMVIPMYAHNFSKYDGQFLMRTLSEIPHKEIDSKEKGSVVYEEVVDGKKVIRYAGPNTLARSPQNLISVKYRGFEFKDSMSFLQGSLDGNVDAARECNDMGVPNKSIATALPITYTYYQQHFLNMGYTPAQAEAALEVLCKKGDCPHARFTGPDVLAQTAFFKREDWGVKQIKDRMDVPKISEARYADQLAGYEMLKCANIGQWYEEYCMRDTLLLVDLLVTLRHNFKKPREEGGFDLDMAKFVTMPSLGYAALYNSLPKETRVELLTDLDMYLEMERAKLGGLSAIRRRYAKANKEYMGSLYDPSKPSSYIQYGDVTSLYPTVMREPLPVGDFRWVDDAAELQSIIAKIPSGAVNAEDHEGYVLFVDLHIPVHLHDELAEFPPLVVKDTVCDGMLSEYTSDLKANLKISSDTVPKLLPYLGDATNYPIHHRRLQFLMKRGVVVKAVHRALGFRQSAYMKSFIEMVAKLRQNAMSEVEKQMLKIVLNSLYGKHLMNNRDRNIYRLVSYDGVEKLASHPSFKDAAPVGDMYAVTKRDTSAKLDVPIAVGVTVLELSKLLMLEIWYKLQDAYPLGDVKLLMTDTDSFIFQVFTDDWYGDLLHKPELQAFRETQDFGNYAKLDASDPRRALGDVSRKGALGLMKDEMCCKVKGEDRFIIKSIHSFCGLRAKMYAYKIVESDGQLTTGCTRAKGLARSWVKDNLVFDDYAKVLHDSVLGDQATFPQIRSKRHTITCTANPKAGLSPYDNKFFYLNAVDSLPFGHYRTRSSSMIL